MTKHHATAGLALESIVIMKRQEVQCFAGFTKSTALVESILLVFLLSGISSQYRGIVFMLWVPHKLKLPHLRFHVNLLSSFFSC